MKEESTGNSYTKTDAISVSAHQVRTSMSAVKWILEMFLAGDLGKLTEEQENLLRKAQEGTNRAISIVSELLLVNKAENLMEEAYKFEDLDLISLVDNSLFTFSGEANQRGIEIIFLKDGLELPKVKADKEKILVVVHNLIENAIKYSNMHGKVFIVLKEDKNIVQFSIKNKGIIIGDDEKSRIFEKFYRAPKAQEKEPIGSGIGLFTTKKIIERHGGQIWFESNPNEGTTFFFTIPIS